MQIYTDFKSPEEAIWTNKKVMCPHYYILKIVFEPDFYSYEHYLSLVGLF